MWIQKPFLYTFQFYLAMGILKHPLSPVGVCMYKPPVVNPGPNVRSAGLNTLIGRGTGNRKAFSDFQGCLAAESVEERGGAC